MSTFDGLSWRIPGAAAATDSLRRHSLVISNDASNAPNSSARRRQIAFNGAPSGGRRRHETKDFIPWLTW